MNAEVKSEGLHGRLLRELAQRLYWGGLFYPLYALILVPQLDRAGWFFSGVLIVLLLIVGIARSLACAQILRTTVALTHDSGKRLISLTAVQGIITGVFITNALCYTHGRSIPEGLLVVGMAGLSSVACGLLSPVPWLAYLHAACEVIPMWVWAIFTHQHYGWTMVVLMLAHGIAMHQVIRMNSRHSRTMFVSQMALEKQSCDLSQARDLAEQASQTRMRFLANMSHEIRTPLNGILGLAEVLSDSPLAPDQRTVVTDLRRSGGHLLAVVNDILDMTKVSSGKLTLEHIPFDLPQLVRDVAVPASVLAEAKHLHLVVELGPEVPRYVKGDPVRIRQILSNLLSNAVKFTAHGEVRLSVLAPNEGWVRADVRDTGIGLTEAQIEGLFREFHQVDSSTTRKYGGTGLGLAISHRLAGLMGGSLSVGSRPGEGSCFSLSVPLAATEVRPATQQAAAGVQGSDLTGVRVLIAEDNAVNRVVIQRIMTGTRAMIEVAENGLIALERHRASPFDLILMDCQMPEMDGYEATRQIRALAGDERLVPILGVTANAFAEDAQRCTDAGMNGHVAKPIDRAVLFREIESALGAARFG